MENFEERLVNFINMADALVKARWEKSWAESGKERPSWVAVPEITHETGKRYVRIVKRERNPQTGELCERGSAFCFIDTTNGDILKAAGWKAPAKGKRGSIFSDDRGRSAITEHGAVYLR